VEQSGKVEAMNEDAFDKAVGMMVRLLFPVFMFCAALICVNALWEKLHDIYWRYYWKHRKDDDYGA
jgi:hypothetical protein